MTEKTQAELDDEAMVQKMRQPIDATAEFHMIRTSTILQLEALIDEVPMKYAKLLLPTLKQGIEPLPPTE